MNKSLLDLPVTTERKTVELCADEPHKGMRCILARGHHGDHEFHSSATTGPITWKQRAS